MSSSELAWTVWDWKSWLGNHMHGLTGHSTPHVFHFFCDSAGNPVIWDKAYHTQGTWSEPYQLLTSNPHGTNPETNSGLCSSF